MDAELINGIVSGAYWRRHPTAESNGAIVYMGAVAPEAEAAHAKLSEENGGPGLLAVTSPERLYSDWLLKGNDSYINKLLAELGLEAILSQS